MKKLIHFLLTLSFLAALGWVLWLGLRHHEEHEEETPEVAAHEEAEAESFIVDLGKERAELLGIVTAKLKPHEQPMQCQATATVLDPAPLIALEGEVSLAEAALNASQAINQRTQALAAASDAPLKNAEASEAQFRADELKLRNLVRTAQLQWGAAFSSDAKARETMIDKLTLGTLALLRAEVMAGQSVDTLPTSARIHILGHESQTITARQVMPATTTDARTQAQGFLISVEAPPFPLRPGMAATAWLELLGKAQAGFIVPRAAVLRHDGRAWVYVQEEPGSYERKAVTLGAPVDDGLFVASAGGLKADDEVVVVGAASLLSEELKAQGGGEPE